MKKVILRMSARAVAAACALCLLPLAQSCSDDYKWDDTDPDFLNSSIYDYLVSEGNFENVVRLIDDMDYATVLAKTGSKTLFVANDSAYEVFYADNDWGVSCYDELSYSQKRLLLFGSMVDNAYLLEMMSSTEGPVAGQCLRRETSQSVLDSVPHWYADDLPVSYNADDKDYWARWREESKGGIYIALDNTAPMMVHFLPAQMSENDITDEDFAIIVGQERDDNDAFVYDCKVVEQDIVCQNGYINRLDKVLVTPQNMAEVLRTNGKTNIFSHLIDRFSVPLYSSTLTSNYRSFWGNDVDSVFEKRYFTDHSYRSLTNDAGNDPINDPSGSDVAYALNYDPGWNQYQPSDKIEKEQEMGVIFAPTDEKLYDYFFSEDGGGRFLLEAYAPDELAAVSSSADLDGIYMAVDQIPLTVIEALVNNLMKLQFCESVPSKFETIKDDAQDPMLDEEDIQYIEDVLLANNGAIYLMDEVLTPAQYAAVSAPAYVSEDMRVMNYAIQSLTWQGSNVNFYAYLLAMSSRFSLFVPKDGFWYVDPVSFASGQTLRALYFEWDETNSRPQVTGYPMEYDFTTDTYTIDKQNALTSSISSSVYSDRLYDILQTHTIVHEDHSETSGIDETSTGVECDQHYFISKNGAPVYVNNATSRADGMTVTGGWGLQHDELSTVTRFDDKTAETNGNGNGMAYQIDGPIVPTIESVYSLMYNNQDKYSEFFELCECDNDEILETLESYLNYDDEGEQIYSSSTDYYNRYTVFVSNGGLPCYDKQTGTVANTATNVRFFNNYRYTVYLPDNDAIEEAIENGLPTWESIREYLELDKEAEDRTELSEDEEEARNEKAAAMVTLLINFIRYHFQDNAIYADTPALTATEYESATMDSESGVYCKLTVSSDGNGSLKVKDLAGNTRTVQSSFKNQLARDYVISSSIISASSFIVVHGIDGVLNYETLTGGRYDSAWATTRAAKRTLRKYRLTD